MKNLQYRRVLVKLSGEALMGKQPFGIDPAVVTQLVAELQLLQQVGVELGVVIGGGNLFRGANLADTGIDRVTGDHMGMLATVMNALALKDGLLKSGVQASVMSSLMVPQVCDSYTQRDARKLVAAGEVLIFAGGTGSPYFTTDTAAALRAVEIQADIVIKATKVDGIYDQDPLKYQSATKYERLTYDQAINQRLGIMDMTAMILCQEQGLDVVVCDIHESGALLNLAQGLSVGTKITP